MIIPIIKLIAAHLLGDFILQSDRLCNMRYSGKFADRISANAIHSVSIFRFGELNRSKELKVTEYVLIGTFLSFTVAILTGYLAEWAISIGN